MQSNEAVLSRVHAMAVAAMAMAAPKNQAAALSVLTSLERQRLAGCGPKLLASLSRLLSHLPPTETADLAAWLAARPWFPAAKILATSGPASPVCGATVAGKKETAKKTVRRRSSVKRLWK
jgi:hypothetical protein